MKEPYLDDASATIGSYYKRVKKVVLQSDTDIYEQANKTMLSLKKKNRGVVWLEPKGNILKIYFYKKGSYASQYYDINPDGWGGYPFIKIRDNNFDLLEIEKLVDQAIKTINNEISQSKI